MAIINDKTIFNQIGSLSFTINLEDCKPGFKDDLFALLQRHDVIETNRLGEAGMLGVQSYKIKGDFCDVMSIYFNNGHYCTIKIPMPFNLKALDTIEIEDGKLKEKQDDLLFKYSDETQILYRLFLIWDMFGLLRTYDLYDNAKIKSIGLINVVYSKELFERFNFKIVELGSYVKNGTIYKTIEVDDIPRYNTKIKHYKATVKYSLAHSRNNLSKDTISDIDLEYLQTAKTFTKAEEMDFLRSKLELPFLDSVDLECDSAGRINQLAPTELIEEHGLEHEINGLKLKFVPKFPNKKTNFCKTQVIESEDLQLGECEETQTIKYISTKNKYLFSYIINRMETTKINILNKYNDTQIHFFKLGDDRVDIIDHIYSITKKFRLIADPNNLLTPQKTNFKSDKKFDEYISENPEDHLNGFLFQHKKIIADRLSILLGVCDLKR